MTVESRYTKYDRWAWLYNLTMGTAYAENQFETLNKTLLPILPERSHILDLCCGTGQLTMLLSSKGYQVTGLDGSEQMLKYARQNSLSHNTESNFILGDARNFSLDNPVDAVISTSASLNHIMSLSELKSVFIQVNNALVNGGVFFFDVNHHGQMKKWWNSHLTEGEIKPTYAWGITPHYNSEARTGAFKVKLYQAENETKFNPTQGSKNIAYKILELKRLIGLRLRVLNNFESWQPDWNYDGLDYPVRGHTPEEIQQALTETGFSRISVLTVDGTELDDNHSAYFMAYKPLPTSS